MNGGFALTSGSSHSANVYNRKRMRLCENPKLESSSGNRSIYFLVSVLEVGVFYLHKQMSGSSVRCYPKNNDHQMVFTHPRPLAVIEVA